VKTLKPLDQRLDVKVDDFLSASCFTTYECGQIRELEREVTQSGVRTSESVEEEVCDAVWHAFSTHPGVFSALVGMLRSDAAINKLKLTLTHSSPNPETVSCG
jgi:hypothetical protein